MSAEPTPAEPTPWLRRLAAAAPAERGELLDRLVLAEFRAALLLSEGEEFARDENYFAQGLTSLGAVEIKQRLEEVLGRGVDTATLLNAPTVDGLLVHLRTEVLADLFTGRGADPADTAPAGGVVVPRHLVQDLLRDLYAS